MTKIKSFITLPPGCLQHPVQPDRIMSQQEYTIAAAAVHASSRIKTLPKLLFV
jgi:hypothetical protein